MNTDILWSKILNQFKDELSSLAYETWFADTELYKLENDKAYIVVPMPIHKRHLNDNYSEMIINKLNNETNINYELNFLFYSINEVCRIIIDENNDCIDGFIIDPCGLNMIFDKELIKKRFSE